MSFDGTWLTRGCKSHIGMGIVLEVNTGFVLDFEALCSFCGGYVKTKKKMDSAAFEAWKAGSHQGKSEINFQGNAGQMEAEAAKSLLARYPTKTFKYTVFVGDGDSSAYNAVCQMNNNNGPYDGAPVIKEYINHVSKRLGTRPRKLNQDQFAIIETKGRRKINQLGGEHQLPDSVIDKFTSYYGNAVRSNVHTDELSLKITIMSSYYHVISSDASPHHSLCPKGPDFWCLYNKAIAKGETPPSHRNMKVYLRLPDGKLRGIRLVYEDLTIPDLLKRCPKDRTQNPNESLHSKIWSK